MKKERREPFEAEAAGEIIWTSTERVSNVAELAGAEAALSRLEQRAWIKTVIWLSVSPTDREIRQETRRLRKSESEGSVDETKSEKRAVDASGWLWT